MTETTNEVPTVNAWASWPVGGLLGPVVNGNGMIWTGKKLMGKHLLVSTAHDAFVWYRLLEPSDLHEYELVPDYPCAPEGALVWAWKAVQMDLLKNDRTNTINMMRADWALLNEGMNEYADDKGLCGEYEKQLGEWNDSFQYMELIGRQKNYEVEVTVHVTYKNTITVEATSEDEASGKVDDLGWDEVTEGLDLGDAEDMNWEVDTCTAQ